MPRTIFRLAVPVLATVVFVLGLTTVSSSPERKGGFRPCPQPPCLAPCVLGEPADVVCRAPTGETLETTFACCCCGSGENSFKRIR